MAIEIVRNLDVVQEEAELPMRIDLSQTLKSDQASERVTIVYRLDDGNDVFFEDGTKAADRTETVSRAETPINHRLKLVHGAGTAVERAVIRQVITDELGIECPDQTFVTIVRKGGA